MSQINIKQLPDGRICIHWFKKDETGPITTPSGTVQSNLGPMQLGGTKGKIVCMKNLETVLPQTLFGRPNVQVTHSDDPRAVTCEACKATEDFAAINWQDYPKG